MKLLFVSNLFPDREQPIRGLDNACLLHYLRDHFEGIRAVGIRPSLSGRGNFVPRKEDEFLKPEYCCPRYIPKIGSRWNHLLMARSLRKTLERVRRKFDFDLVLGSWLYPDGCALSRLAGDMKFPYWLICQGSDAHSYLEMPVRRRLIVEASNKSRGVITRSADLARRLKEAGVGEQRLYPVYNGVDTKVFYPTEDRAEACRMVGLDPACDYLLFVGNLLPVKNPLLLIKAWEQARATNPERELRLLMIGAGPMEAEIRAESERAGLAKSLELLGRRPPDEVAGYMRAAGALVLSSHNEGVPNVVLEAFASGVPVVSTDVGGISEVLNSGDLGILVKPNNVDALCMGILEVMNRPSNEDNSVVGSNYSWERTAEAYAGLLNA